MNSDADAAGTRYTRKRAVEDGALVDVDVSEAARDVGFTMPVALTFDAWGEVAGVRDRKPLNSEAVTKEQLRAVLLALRCAIEESGTWENPVRFSAVLAAGPTRSAVNFRALLVADDHGNDALTITLTQDD